MKSSVRGKNTSLVEVQHVAKYGIWLYVNDSEYLLMFKEYPWFEKATVSQIYNVKLVHKNHLHWPDLDVDLELESLKSPHHYPLVYKK